jgi:hypothetical protein
MAQQMILCAGPMRDLQPGHTPRFASARVVELGDFLPRQLVDGSDVLVYTQRANRLFAYLGTLRAVSLDEAARCLRFESYEPFSAPVVASDESHAIDRPEMRAPLNGWGQHDFNYVDESAVTAVIAASTNPTEALLWRAAYGCAQ